MNILFLYAGVIDPQKGGVQRVTSVLVDYFLEEGYSVLFLVLGQKKNQQIYPIKQFFLLYNSCFCNKVNIDFIVIENKNRENARFECILGKLDLMDRIIYDCVNFDYKKLHAIDNNMVDKVFSQEREYAMNYLHKSLVN